MLNSSKSFLCLDFGAGSLKAAEFDTNEAGALVLRQYGIKSLGLAGSQDAAREAALRKALQDLIAERAFGSRNANVCAAGFHVFSKFVKLPPVDSSKVGQIIQYEAQQNVPFPLEEVVWDFQILGTTSSGELEVLLVAIKSEFVEGLFRTADANGLRLQLVDVSPAALCNAFRFNYPEVEGCAMLLDIGAKTSNLIFFEKSKVYSRSINIGANSITQDFAAEAKLRFNEAEQVKIAEGFVSLGGAYEEPENPHQAAISKIARQVMTRLHIQVNQTIQFYRGQQGGSAPQQLFLAGGGSIMAYTREFFAEKLNVPVEYFNPFRSIQIDPSINLEELAGVAHLFGELVGLGLRNIAQCPIELNLVPKSIRKRQQFSQKKPYFIAAVFSLVAVVFAIGWFFDRVAAVQSEGLAKIEKELKPLESDQLKLQAAKSQIDATRKQIDEFGAWGAQRLLWGDLLTDLREALIKTENQQKKPGLEAGVWIETLGSTNFLAAAAPASESEDQDNSTPRMIMDPILLKRYGLLMSPEMRARYGMMGGGTTETNSTGTAANTNTIETVKVRFKAMNMNRGGSSSANRELANELQTELKKIPLLDPDGTKLNDDEWENVTDASAVTFSFGATLKLKTPIKKI